MTFSYSQDNGICKVRQCWVHITGKLLLSTKSALKHRCHATVPNSGEFSLFAFWGCLGTVPSPGTKQQDEKAAPFTPEQPPLRQPVPAAGTGRARMCFGCRSFILQTPPTARIDSRTKSLTLCHRKSLSSEELFWDYIHGILIVFGNCRRWKYMVQTCHASKCTAFCSGMTFHRKARFKATLLKSTRK